MSARVLVLLLLAPLALAAAEPRVDALGDPLPVGAVTRLGTTRLRPPGRLDALLFAPDGKRLASFDEWGSARAGLSIWDAATGKELRRIALPYSHLLSWTWGPGRSVAILRRRGRRLDSEMLTVDFDSARPEPALLTKDSFDRVAVSSAADLLAIALPDPPNGNTTIELRALAPNKPLAELRLVQTIRISSDSTNSVSFTPDGHVLLVELGEVTTYWDVATGKERGRAKAPARSMASAVSNQRLAVGLADGGLWLYDLIAKKEQRFKDLHRPPGPADRGLGGVEWVALSANGATVATVGNEQAIRVWDAASGKKRHEFAIDSFVRAMSFSPDGKMLATGGYGGLIRLFDLVTGKELAAPAGHQQAVISVAFADDGRAAVTTSRDRSIRVWDVATGRERRQIAPGGPSSLCGMAPDGRSFVAGVYSPERKAALVRRWSVANGQEIPTPEIVARSVQLSADGRTLATVRGESVELRDWPSGALRREIKLPRPRSKDFTSLGVINAVSSDGKRVVTSTEFVLLGSGGFALDAEGGEMDLWDADTGNRLAVLGNGDFQGVCFAPAGELLIASRYHFPGSRQPEDDHRGAVALLHPTTGSLIRELALPELPPDEIRPSISSLALSLDGRTAYVGLIDGGIYACEVATGGVRYKLAGHRAAVFDLAAHPKTRRLISAGGDTTALVWDISLPAAAAPTDSDAAWKDLTMPDAGKAYQAMAALAASPDVVRFITGHLPPTGPGPGDAALDRLVAELDSSDFAKREKAEAELDKLGDLAADGIRARLAKAKTTESERRLKRVVQKIDSAALAPPRLREIRAIELLEYLATPEARAVLAMIAKGNPNSRRTQDAAAALRR